MLHVGAVGIPAALGNAFAVPEEFDASKEYEITFWAKNDTNINQTEIYKQAIADFQELYPNITVNLRLYTDYGDIYNDVITNISTGTTPNVCITYPDHIATYLTGDNVVAPLDELFADEKCGLGGSEVRFDSPAQEQIVPQFLDECRLDGHYYAIPYMRSTEACYINKTYVEALGYTLPETLTIAYLGSPRTEFTMSVGDEPIPLTASGGNGTYTWSSSDDGIASVDAGGHVTAVSQGRATLTVTEPPRRLYFKALLTRL